MTGNPLEFFQPSLGYWNEEKERQRHETHEYFVEGPPWDEQLESGVIRLDNAMRDAEGEDLAATTAESDESTRD
jgi:hypothetical protein